MLAIALIEKPIIPNADVDALESFLYSYLDYHYKNQTIYQFSAFIHQCISVVHIAYDILYEKYGPFPESLLPVSYNGVQELSEGGNLCEIFKVLQRTLEKILKALQLNTGKNRLSLQAMEYVHTHYSEEITLGQLAKKISVSPSYLSKIFKDDFGIPFSEYLLHFRMKSAQKLLSQGTRKIYEVAALVGYQDVAQFTKMFKRNMALRLCNGSNPKILLFYKKIPLHVSLYYFIIAALR
ncbi:MAG: helix-turn-helix domain-containing protein [Provencibacterium sp.]|jgi:YesN/AraC family two-component response regulator|nr:helix-turn-helix domain-containing protein [Provencibacterium sp.]